MTTPTLDALRALAQKWRERIDKSRELGLMIGPLAIKECADELEAVLSSALASASAGQHVCYDWAMEGLGCAVCNPVARETLAALAPPRAPETPQTHSAARTEPIVVYGHRGDDIAGLLEVDEPETPQTPFAWIPQGIAHGPVEILPAVPGWRWVCVSYPDVFKLERVEPAPPPPSESR